MTNLMAEAETKEAHTPGEWEAVAKSEHHGWYVEDAAGRTVCDLYFIDCHGRLHEHVGHEAEANARLIAAAPDLLAALKAMRDAAVYQCGSQADAAPKSLGKMADDMLLDALSLARAAIQRAEA